MSDNERVMKFLEWMAARAQQERERRDRDAMMQWWENLGLVMHAWAAIVIETTKGGREEHALEYGDPQILVPLWCTMTGMLRGSQRYEPGERVAREILDRLREFPVVVFAGEALLKPEHR